LAVRLLPRVRPWDRTLSHYAAKPTTYYRYRDSGAYRRDYQSFPTLLVVTTSEAAEARFTHQAYLAQQRYSGMPLSIFLTTTSRIEGCSGGILGPIWRSAAASWADDPARVCWLPRLRRQDNTISGPEAQYAEPSAVSSTQT